MLQPSSSPGLPGAECARLGANELAAAAVDLMPPVGHLRVGVVGPCEATAYLEARARVVRVGPSSASLGDYHAIVADAGALPLDDLDLVLWDGETPMSSEQLAAALAPAGVVVAGSAAGPLLRGAGLRVRTLRAGVVRGDDPRPRVGVHPRLSALDRTMCVDRTRVLDALRTPPWVGPSADAGGTPEALLEALRTQLRVGEPDVRTLPWPGIGAPSNPEGTDDVLAVMPHPDDETIYAGGTLAALARAGRRVGLVVATDGAGGRGGTDLSSRRAAELLSACAVLGVSSARCLGWADTGKYRDRDRSQAATAADALRAWGLDEALGDLVAAIRRARPRTLVSLDPQLDPNLSLHGHHLAVGLLVTVAYHLAASPTFRPQLGPPWAAAEHRVIASPHVAAARASFMPIDAEVKLRALTCHRTQAYSTRALIAGLERGDPRARIEGTRPLQARNESPWLLATRSPGSTRFSTPPSTGWPEHAAAVAARPRDRDALVALFERQSGALPADPARRASVEALADPRSVVVVAGQQVGWLGGPAYTLIKALAAVDLARRLAISGVRAVPVFWMASTDHDVDEVATAPTLEGPKVRLSLRHDGRPVAALVVPENVDQATQAWLELLPAAARDAATSVCAAYRPGTSMTEAFASLLAELTAGTGLLLLDPSDSAFARLASPVLERELLGPEPARSRLGSGPVPIERDVSEVFVLDDAGRRCRVHERGTDELRSMLREAPARFSAAALLRPIVQDHVLPTVATVAGPSEAEYLQQMQPLYDWAGLVPSVVVRRPSVRPITDADLRALEPVGGFEELLDHPHALAAIGLRALPAATRSWIERCAALEGVLFAVRSGREGLDAASAAWSSLREDAATALKGQRTARAWPGHRDVIDRCLRTGLHLSRAIRRVFKLRRSLLRDGRRGAPEAVRAWRRVHGAVERRLTVAELRARWGPELSSTLLAAFASLDADHVRLIGSPA